MKIESIRNAGALFFGLGVGLLLIAGLGCSSAQTREQVRADLDSPSFAAIEIQGASYREVFEAARDVIGSYRFGVNRVDAARGVLTTYAKRSVGIASPWDVEQSTIGQELEEFANQQERVIRVEFDRVDEGSAEDDAVRGRIEVLVSRVHRPNWRLESQSIRLSTHARSRDAQGKIESGAFREVIGHDALFAQRVAGAIAARFE